MIRIEYTLYCQSETPMSLHPAVIIIQTLFGIEMSPEALSNQPTS
jgi:hypothetical protein